MHVTAESSARFAGSGELSVFGGRLNTDASALANIALR